MYEWIGPLVVALTTGVVVLLKSLFGTDKPQVTSVEHTKPDIKVTHDEDDAQRLRDLGL